MQVDLSQIAAVGFLGIFLAIVVWLALVVLVLWVLYTIIWLAVRRGLAEFHHPGMRLKDALQIERRKDAREMGWSLEE